MANLYPVTDASGSIKLAPDAIKLQNSVSLSLVQLGNGMFPLPKSTTVGVPTPGNVVLNPTPRNQDIVALPFPFIKNVDQKDFELRSGTSITSPLSAFNGQVLAGQGLTVLVRDYAALIEGVPLSDNSCGVDPNQVWVLPVPVGQSYVILAAPPNVNPEDGTAYQNFGSGMVTVVTSLPPQNPGSQYLQLATVNVPVGTPTAGYSKSRPWQANAPYPGVGSTLSININGDGVRTLTLPVTKGVVLWPQVQDIVRALTANNPAKQAAYSNFTITSDRYLPPTYCYLTLTSGLPGVGSSVVVTGGTAAPILGLGLANGGTEVVGTSGQITQVTQNMITDTRVFLTNVGVLSGQMAALQGQTLSLSNQVTILSSTVGSLSTTVGSLSSSVALTTAVVASIQDTVATLQSNYADLSSSLGSAQTTIADLISQGAAQTDQIAALNVAVANISTQLSAISDSLTSLTVTVNNLNVGQTVTPAQITSLQTAVSDLGSSLTSAQAAINQLVNDDEVTSSQVASLTAQLTNFGSSLSSLTSAVSALTSGQAATAAQLTALHQAFTDLLNQELSDADAISVLAVTADSVYSQLAPMLNSLNVLAASVSSLNAGQTLNNNQISGLQSMVANVGGSIMSLQGQVSSLQSQVDNIPRGLTGSWDGYTFANCRDLAYWDSGSSLSGSYNAQIDVSNGCIRTSSVQDFPNYSQQGITITTGTWGWNAQGNWTYVPPADVTIQGGNDWNSPSRTGGSTWIRGGFGFNKGGDVHIVSGTGNVAGNIYLSPQSGGNMYSTGSVIIENGVGLQANGISATSLGCSGDVAINTAGAGLRVKEGSNAKMGLVALAAGTATVFTSAVTSNSRIFLTQQNGNGTPGALYISARTAGTSFSITSTAGADVSDVAWMIVEPS